MTLPEFEDLLRRTMGLDSASVSPAMIERAVAGRRKALGLGGDAYSRLIQSSAEELQELIEEVVVPETWFFRGREAFSLLARIAVEEWAGGTARLLSLPCSSGEEPYSMAMALLDAGLDAGRFHIDAVDISRRSLARARAGSYGRNSFRGDGLDFRERHFAEAGTGSGWQLDERVRKQVALREGNLFSPLLLAGEAPYDVIFCRNVLIYFDREAQGQVLGLLARLLSPRGVLFVGPSETSLAAESGFASVRAPQAFAFRKAGTGRPGPAPALASPPPFVPPPRLVRPPASMPAPRSFLTVPPAPAVAVAPRDELAEARLLADQGRFPEAVARCEEGLRAHGPSPAAYYLLGVVHDAMRRHADAAAFYRKALYLDPEHRDVLAQLASLLEGQGDAAGARVLNERARRVAAKQGA